MVSVLRHWLSLYLYHLLYPIDECEDSRINSKVVWLSASDAPADDPDNFDATAMVCLTDERSTGVTLNQCVKILQVFLVNTFISWLVWFDISSNSSHLQYASLEVLDEQAY